MNPGDGFGENETIKYNLKSVSGIFHMIHRIHEMPVGVQKLADYTITVICYFGRLRGW